MTTSQRSDEPQVPRGWARHPPERMLITPLVAGVGGLIAFFIVVFVVVWLPIHTFDPPASDDWTRSRTTPSRAATCSPRTAATSATPATRGRRTFARRSTSSTRRSRSPATSTGATRRRTCSGTERTGPDLSQESGWHPDDWQNAHFYDPRFIDPLSLMPPMKSLFSERPGRPARHVRRDAERQVGPAALCRTALREAHRAREPGLPAAVHRLQRRAQADPLEGNDKILNVAEGPARGGGETSRRSTGATGSRATRCRSQSRTSCVGKEVFIDRCVGCHGLEG